MDSFASLHSLSMPHYTWHLAFSFLFLFLPHFISALQLENRDPKPLKSRLKHYLSQCRDSSLSRASPRSPEISQIPLKPSPCRPTTICFLTSTPLARAHIHGRPRIWRAIMGCFQAHSPKTQSWEMPFWRVAKPTVLLKRKIGSCAFDFLDEISVLTSRRFPIAIPGILLSPLSIWLNLYSSLFGFWDTEEGKDWIFNLNVIIWFCFLYFPAIFLLTQQIFCVFE